MREERRGRRTRAIRPDDRREVAERADDLPAAVRLPILDLEAVEAAALLRHCESRAVGGSLWRNSYVQEESYCQRYLAFDEVSGRRSNPRFQYRRNLGFIISFALPASPRL